MTPGRHHRPPPFPTLVTGALSLVLLSLGFYSNLWRVADPGWFQTHQRDTEGHVVGRMVKSRQDGMLSAAGLLGVGQQRSPSEEGPGPSIEVQDEQAEWPGDSLVEHQYETYEHDLSIDTYSVYLSQIGGQGVVFSALNRLSPLSPRATLDSFHLLTSVLSALALTLVILWFGGEFGWVVALLLLGSTVLSQWLVVFGRNLWWNMWAFYLPLVSVLLYLRHRKPPDIHALAFGSLIFLSVLIKCLVNGYEYITTTLVMMLVPVVYYAVLEGWSRRRILQVTSIAVLGSTLAVSVSVAVLISQIAAVKGSLADGITHLAFSLRARTHGASQDFPASYAQNLEAGTIDVLILYLKGVYFDLNNYLKTGNPLVSRFVFSIRFLYLGILFFSMSLVVGFRQNQFFRGSERRKHRALLCATWFSTLAPLSWFMLFKAHSHEHPHMNYIVWHMPFTLFGFAVCGVALRGCFSGFRRWPRSS